MEKMHRSQHKQFSPIPRNKLTLLLIIVLLFSIFIFKTILYFNQVVVKTENAILNSGPGIEFSKKVEVPLGTRLTIISSSYHWYHVKTENNKFGWIADWMINPRDVKKITDISNSTIVLDAGHGGSDSGALSIDGFEEKEFTLKYIKELANKLRNDGAKVYLTRNKDKFVSLSSRSLLAKRTHADAFISIHFDSSPEANSASGLTTYYYNKNNSYNLAQCLNAQLATLNSDNRGIDFGNFLVLRDNPCPSTLLELGYINTTKDFVLINSKKYRNSATDDIEDGLKKYFASR